LTVHLKSERYRYDRPFSYEGSSPRYGPLISQKVRLASSFIVCDFTRWYGQQTTLFRALNGPDIEPLTRQALSLLSESFVSTRLKHRLQTAEITLITS